MTLREIPFPEGISSSSAHTTTVDPQKAKTSRRRRLEIQRLKSSYQECNTINGCDENAQPRTCGAHGSVSVMGRRREMEDTVKVEKGWLYDKYDYYGVYDGHGGCHVAEECREKMHEIVKKEVDTWRKKMVMDGCDAVDWEGVMGRGFERMDEEVGNKEKGSFGKENEMTVGSTVVVAIVGKDEIVVANCGDSRAVICRNGVALPLSLDHKPDRPDELARIEAAGGRVINWNGYRVLGVLATSRSIGDHYLKPYVSSVPEITISKRTEADEFMILASDGLWDVISNEVACQVVRRCLSGRIKSHEILNQISKISSNRAELAALLLTELAIAKGSKDNISVIVVELKKSRRSASKTTLV